ncbi:MAG: serine/threonine-protein kinase [Pseudomonadota bacterium]
MTQDRPIDGEPADSLRPGTPLLQGQFLIDGFLNAGGFGITYLARDSLERRVVIKECFPSSMCCRSQEVVRARSNDQQDDFDQIVRLFGKEARRLAKLDHPNIVGVRDVFEDNGTAYMALDFVDGRDLLDVIEQQPHRLSPAMIEDMTLALLDAIAHVHSMGMLHRDISPDNILIDGDNAPVLIDFGAARDTARRKSRVLSGLHVVKDGYSPQEFYLAQGEQGPASDLYSLAATLYHVLTGAPPTYGHLRLAALAERKPDPYVPLVDRVEGFERSFLEAIDQTLSVFSKERLQSAGEWMDAILGQVASAPEPAPDSAFASRERQSLPPVALSDPAIDDKIRQLVETTNPEVLRMQERAAEEKEALRRAEAEAEAEREAARQRRLEAARAEAEEAAAFACKVKPRRVISKGISAVPRPISNDAADVLALEAGDEDEGTQEAALPGKPPSFLRRTLGGVWRGATKRTKMEGVRT